MIQFTKLTNSESKKGGFEFKIRPEDRPKGFILIEEFNYEITSKPTVKR